MTRTRRCLLLFFRCLFILFIGVLHMGAKKISRPADPVFYLNPKWSPDGSAVAFASNFEGKLAVYTIKVASRKISRVTALEDECGLPAWSPNGKALVYHKNIKD